MATTATATRAGTVDVPAAHGLAALALKLQHPLVRIRARALANLLFKLRERLVDVGAQPRLAVDGLMKELVASLAERELEATALQVLQLLLLDATMGEQATRVCAEALRRHGAAAAFQRGGLATGNNPHTTAGSQATYEALLHRLLATSSSVHEERAVPPQPAPGEHYRIARAPSPALSLASSLASSHGSPVVHVPTPATVSALVAAQRAAHKTDTPSDPLTSQGWRFPRVALAAVDEQFLFEFEVKWRLRTSVPEIVEMCDTFRHDLLRDFPPQVFLQRPAMLLRVLELVRQPIVPAATTPELSFGVNYFDEPASRASFVWKPSVLATALHVSTLKALESWLAAMRHAIEISLNPMYHTFRSSSEASSSALTLPTTGFDHRRLYYPRVADEEDSIDREERGMSLGGAAFLILATLLRLLSGDQYPHLHLINVIHVVTDLLPERSVSPHGSGTKHLDKTRLEALFAILVEIVRIEARDRGAFMNDRIVDWFTVVLKLFQPSVFRVEDGSTGGNSGSDAAIVIPFTLWEWILQQVAGDGKRDDTKIQLLGQVDSSVSLTIAQLVRSNKDKVLLSAVLHDDATRPVTLQQAEQILRAVPSLSEHQRSVAVQLILQAICSALVAVEDGHPSKDAINCLLIRTLSSGAHESTPRIEDFTAAFYEGFIDWILEDSSSSIPSSRLKIVLSTISASAEYLRLLLCSLAANEAFGTGAFEALWRFAELLIRGFEKVLGESDPDFTAHAFSKSMAILQHLAYFDSSASTVNEVHRRLQRSFLNLAGLAEAVISAQGQLLGVARCLVHRTAFIRRAAASGLLDRLDQFGVESVHRVTRGSVVSVDPFGQFADGKGESPKRVLEQEFPSILQPRVNGGDGRRNDPTSSGSSVLHRVSRLRKLLSSLSTTDGDQDSTQGTVKSTLHQLLIDLVHASSVDFTILEEAGEVEELIHATIRLLSEGEEIEPTWLYDIRASSLSIVRVLLMRSGAWRQWIRQDMRVLGVLLSFVFDEDARVRAEMYFIVVALACGLETQTSKGSEFELVVPSEFSATFGLFSERWSASGISVKQFVDAVKQHSSGIDHEIAHTPSDPVPANVSTDQAFQCLWNRLLSAKSFRTFLDGLYAVIQACYARRDVCAKISARWGEASFRRYLETPPTSSKDQVVMAAILSMLTVVFDTMSADQQMDIVLLLRHKVIPLQLSRGRDSPKTTSLPAEVARLLLRISKSDLSAMLAPLLIDTGLVKNLGALVVASAGSALSQRSLWIQVVLAALDRTKRQPENMSTRQQILDAVRMPLHAFAGRHHVPGSFQERDAYAYAVSCLVRSNDSDAPWRARLLFETLSNFRSTGFQVASTMLSASEHETTGRVLRLAADTMRETMESDAVRSSAAELLFDFFRRVERDALPLYGSYVDWGRFVPDIIHDLISSTQTRDKCSVRLNLSRIQLLRFFVSQPERFAGTVFADVLAIVVSNTRDDSRALLAVLELLSIRRAFEAYQHHIVEFLHFQPTDDTVWRRTILPVVLNTVSEASKLLWAVFQHSSSSRSGIMEASPLISQLSETISDIASSLDSLSTIEAGQAQLHYDPLDQCGKLLSVVLSTAATVSLPPDASRRLLRGIVRLLDPTHPRLFRLSFTRVVPAILCLRSGDLSTEAIVAMHAVPMGHNLWSAYTELCDLQPLDPGATHRRTPSYLQHLRRVACSLHVILSQSEDASSSMCESHQGAVQRAIDAIRNSFAAVRMAGGFGAKSAKRSDDGFVVETCEAIQLHCQILSGLFVQSRRAQTLAREEQLPSVFANNWNTMRVAHRRGSGVLVSALRLLQNFIHASDSNKTSLATTVATTGVNPRVLTAGDGERNLLAMIGELALGSSTSAPFDERWSCIAGSILKSAFLHIECLHSAMKTGLVGKLFSSVVERCKRQRQTVKSPSAQEEQTLTELVGVLASVASSDEGRQMVLQIRDLKDLLDDFFHFPEGSNLYVTGALFVRNMAFSKFSKSHFSVWEPVMDQILALLYRLGDNSNQVHDKKTLGLIAADHFSTALLCLVHDNQRAQSLMQSSRKTLVLCRDTIRAWNRMSEGTSSENAHRVGMVVSNLERVNVLISGDQGTQIESERL